MAMKVMRTLFIDIKNIITNVGRPWLFVNGLSLAYLFVQLVNFFIILLLLILFYEICVSIFILISEYIVSLLKFSILYLFIYFLICFFNIRYLGYYQFKFFGLSLNYPKEYIYKYWIIIKTYNYFFLVLIHIFLLSLLIFSWYNNVLYILFISLFYLFVIISIKVKIKWDALDLNYKTKIWNLGLNVIIILILGFYINLIIEYLIPSFFFKINGFEYFWKTFQNKAIFNLNFERSNLRWFNLYGLKKEYFVNMFFFTFKKNLNDQYILYNYNSAVKDNLPSLKKEYDKTILDYVNFNNVNILLLQENLKLDTENLLDINRSKNNITIIEFCNNTFYTDYDIKKILGYETKSYDIFNIFNLKNFLYNKYNFIIQNHLENKDIYPLEENNFLLKNLLKRDLLNYNYLLFEQDNENIKIYEDYIQFTKQKIIFNKNVYDILLLKKNWKPIDFIKFYKNQNFYNKDLNLFNSIKIQYLSLKDFNNLLYFYTTRIRTFITKLDLFILNWENNQIEIKNLLIKEHYTPNNFNIKKVLKDLLIGLRNDPNDLLVKNIKMEKNKSISYFNTDDFLDFIELFFDKVINNRILKTNLITNFNLDEYENTPRKSISKDNEYKNNNIDLNILKKKLEEFAYQKYFKKIIFSLKELDDIFNIYYIYEDNNIYEVDIRINKVNMITYKEYNNRIFNIHMYEEMLYSNEINFKQNLFNNLHYTYLKFINNIKNFFPLKNIKNTLFNKIINYYENRLSFINKKDKFFTLNNMEKIIYFFKHNAKSMTYDEHKRLLSFYNIKKYSISYMRYHNIKANYKLLYDYDILDNILFRHLNFQFWNDKNWSQRDLDDLMKYYKIIDEISKQQKYIIKEKENITLRDFSIKVDNIYNNMHKSVYENINKNKDINEDIVSKEDINEDIVSKEDINEDNNNISIINESEKEPITFDNDNEIEINSESESESEIIRKQIAISKLIHQHELLLYINMNLDELYQIMLETNYPQYEEYTKLKIRMYFFDEAKSLLLKYFKQTIIKKDLDEYMFNINEIDKIENNIIVFSVKCRDNYDTFIRDNDYYYNELLEQIDKYNNFMQKYEYYDNILHKQTSKSNIKNKIMYSSEYKKFVKQHSDILKDKQKLSQIKDLYYNKDSWIEYFTQIKDYNNAIFELMKISQIYQFKIAELDLIYDFYLKKIFYYKKMEHFLDIVFDKYNIEMNDMWEYLKEKHNEILVGTQLEEISIQEQNQDLQYQIIDQQLEIIDQYKINLQLQLENMKQRYFLDILKTYPNIKYKNVYELDKALKKKDWEFYKIHRLNEEHWNKNFKDYNKIINKKPYVFRK